MHLVGCLHFFSVQIGVPVQNKYGFVNPNYAAEIAARAFNYAGDYMTTIGEELIPFNGLANREFAKIAQAYLVQLIPGSWVIYPPSLPNIPHVKAIWEYK
jgi:hypothetical protein